MSVEVKVNTANFDRSVKRYGAAVMGAMINAMNESVQKLDEESQKLAPYATGELENSSTTRVTVGSDKVEGEVIFSAEYAAGVHNKLDGTRGPGTASKPSTPYGNPGPNFLQNPQRGLGQDGTYQKILVEKVNNL